MDGPPLLEYNLHKVEWLLIHLFEIAALGNRNHSGRHLFDLIALHVG